MKKVRPIHYRDRPSFQTLRIQTVFNKQSNNLRMLAQSDVERFPPLSGRFRPKPDQDFSAQISPIARIDPCFYPVIDYENSIPMIGRHQNSTGRSADCDITVNNFHIYHGPEYLLSS
jgi:hypothetical protein